MNYSYIGSELELFRNALNWKAYYRQLIAQYLGAEVLEVGAGIGATTESLCRGSHLRWLCLEPDPLLVDELKTSIASGYLPKYCEQRVGTLHDVRREEKFDTIIYIDVLEHIKDDKVELKLAREHLKYGGFLVVLAPAHQWLFTPFDEALGHHRRYSKNTLLAVIPDSFECVNLNYLDSVGLIASLGNRFLLKRKMPTKQQTMVPLSRILDPLLNYSVDKTVIGVWRS